MFILCLLSFPGRVQAWRHRRYRPLQAAAKDHLWSASGVRLHRRGGQHGGPIPGPGQKPDPAVFCQEHSRGGACKFPVRLVDPAGEPAA